LRAKYIKAEGLGRKGMPKPLRLSRSRLPPVMLATVSYRTSTPALRARSIMVLFSAVVVKAELVDLRAFMGGAQILDRGSARAGDAEHGAELGGGGTHCACSPIGWHMRCRAVDEQ